MIAAQEELDWEVYGLYGLVDADLVRPDPPPIQLGERAFEIVLARRTVEGNEGQRGSSGTGRAGHRTSG